jgi:alkylhydroperoxidase family enzyme
MHTQEALKDGETQQRIFLISAWKESNLFNEKEKAILAITEEITLISGHGLSDANYQKGEELFGKDTMAQIIMTVVAINSWNRIAISTKL